MKSKYDISDVDIINEAYNQTNNQNIDILLQEGKLTDIIGKIKWGEIKEGAKKIYNWLKENGGKTAVGVGTGGALWGIGDLFSGTGEGISTGLKIAASIAGIILAGFGLKKIIPLFTDSSSINEMKEKADDKLTYNLLDQIDKLHISEENKIRLLNKIIDSENELKTEIIEV